MKSISLVKRWMNRWGIFTRKKIIYGALTVFTAWLATYSVFGARGIIAKKALESTLEDMKRTNNDLEVVNEQLQNTIKNIKKDPEYFEQYVRSKTNLVKDDEIIYHFK